MDLQEIQQHAERGQLVNLTYEQDGHTLSVLGRIRGVLPEASGAQYFQSPAQRGDGIWFEPLMPSLISTRSVIKVEPER